MISKRHMNLSVIRWVKARRGLFLPNALKIRILMPMKVRMMEHQHQCQLTSRHPIIFDSQN